MLATKKSAGAQKPLPWLLLCACVLSACTPPGPRALLEGEKLIHEEKYLPAVEKLQRAVELLPQNAQAWNHLGLAYHGAGQFDNAIRAYQHALAPGRNLAVAHYNLGNLYYEQGNYPAAIDELRAYTVLQPQHLSSWLKLASSQIRLRQYDAADKSYRYILSLDPKLPEAWNGLGIASLHLRGRSRDAVQYFNTSLQGNYPPALLNLALASQYYLNNRQVALQKYREYLALNPHPENWQFAHDLAGQLDLELNPPPKPVVTNVVANVATNLNLPPAVTNAAPRLAVTNTPLSPPQVTNASRTNVASVPRAVATNGPATLPAPAPMREPVIEITRVPDPPVIRPAQDKPPVTNTSLPLVVVTRPARVEAPTPAPLTPAPTPSPAVPVKTNVSVPVSAAEVTAPTNKPGFLQRLNPANLFRRTPKSPVAPVPLTNSTEIVSKAVTDSQASPGKLSTVTPLPPQPPPARYTYHILNRPAVGSRVEAEPFFDRGLTAQRRGQLAEAVAAYQKAAQLDPSFFEAQHNLAMATGEMGNVPQSLLAYETALGIQPLSQVARYNFALALRDANYFQDSANELEKVLADNPKDAESHLALANLYAQQLGRRQLAREHYQKVLSLDPRHPKATEIRYWLAANP